MDMFKIKEENTDGMEMPTPCQSCGTWFDLNDGVGSDKWYKDTVICEDCGRLEEREIELDDEIETCQNEISDAEWTLTDRKKELGELNTKMGQLQDQIAEQKGT